MINFVQTGTPNPIEDDFRALWSIEFEDLFVPRSGVSADDRAAVKIITDTTRKRDDGTFEISFL